MKKILFFLLLALPVFLNGCHETVVDDTSLAEADRLLDYDADSALSMLTSIDRNSLSGEGNRAYHALLLTQARYKCYVTATSDSLINEAVAYYEKHRDERDKLTRAYLYKGAVMEELGESEEAMRNYKQALEVADPDDLFNQGYIRLRIANTYRDNMVADNSDITMLKEAMRYFEKVPDSFYMLACLSEIGNCYVKVDKDSALEYCKSAVELARTLHDQGQEQEILINIAKLLMFSDHAADVDAAKQIALSILQNDSLRSNSTDDVLMIATLTLAQQGKQDSANYYLKQVSPIEQLSPGLQVFYNKCLAELAMNQGDRLQFKNYMRKANNLADSIATNAMQLRLREVESRFDNEVLKYEALRYKTNWIISLLSCLLIIGALVMLALILKNKSSKYKRQLQESELLIEQLRKDSHQLSLQLEDNKAMNDSLKQTIKNQIETFTRLVEEHQKQFSLSPKKFGQLFESSYKVAQPDGSFWAGIRAYADSTCHGIITSSLEVCPSLDESEVRFLSLCCCDLPTSVIMACLGYVNSHSVYNKKRRIAEALGLTGKLEDYIESFKMS